MKWIGVIVLVIIGILAAIVAVEYLTVSIHSLPSFIPGHHAGKRGHYHKRGAVAGFVAVVAFAVAGYLAYRFTRGRPHPAAVAEGGASSTDQLL
jgi:uncharacterized membrane protein YidH (DUF202 family)